MHSKTHQPAATVAITGATGFLGSLIAGLFLDRTDTTVVLPTRSPKTVDDMLAPIVDEMIAQGKNATIEEFRDRVHVVTMPPAAEVGELFEVFQELGVKEIINSAGCVDYYDRDRLHEGNIVLTQELLSVAEKLEVDRFVHLSTAFCCGFTEGEVPEEILDEPESDPTLYTRSKRDAERLVAASNVPWQIMRPSVVIGDSQDGRYEGKLYGVYQLWAAAERFLCRNYLPVLHAIAPDSPIHFIHQDAFMEGFWGLYLHMPLQEVANLVSRYDTLPTLRDVWELWVDECARPQKVYYYQSMDQVPRDQLDRRQLSWVEFTGINLEIATWDWKFNTGHLDRLRDQGLVFNDATLETVTVCQDRFIAESEKIQRFLTRFAEERKVETERVEATAATA